MVANGIPGFAQNSRTTGIAREVGGAIAA